MPSSPGVFQFSKFFCVALSESICIFLFGLSSSPSNSFSMLFIHSVFLLCTLRSHILFPNCFVFLWSSLGLFSCILPLLDHRNFFRCFGMSFFLCIVLSCLDIFLDFFLLPVTSGLFPHVVLIVLLIALLSSFRHNLSHRSSSVIFIVVVDFLSTFPVLVA